MRLRPVYRPVVILHENLSENQQEGEKLGIEHAQIYFSLDLPSSLFFSKAHDFDTSRRKNMYVIVINSEYNNTILHRTCHFSQRH